MVETAAVLAVIRTARPAFRNKHDKVAFAIHASFVTSGYRLIAAGAAAEADTSGECCWSGSSQNALSLQGRVERKDEATAY